MDKRANKLKQLRRDKDAVKKIKNEGTETAINVLQIIPAYVLAVKFGVREYPAFQISVPVPPIYQTCVTGFDCDGYDGQRNGA